MAKKQSTKQEKAAPMIYVGPQFRDSELRTFKVYPEGIPAAYKDNAVYKHLFVTADRLAEARAELRRKGTAMNTFYKAAIAEHESKKEG